MRHTTRQQLNDQIRTHLLQLVRSTLEENSKDHQTIHPGTTYDSSFEHKFLSRIYECDPNDSDSLWKLERIAEEWYQNDMTNPFEKAWSFFVGLITEPR